VVGARFPLAIEALLCVFDKLTMFF